MKRTSLFFARFVWLPDLMPHPQRLGTIGKSHAASLWKLKLWSAWEGDSVCSSGRSEGSKGMDTPTGRPIPATHVFSCQLLTTQK